MSVKNNTNLSFAARPHVMVVDDDARIRDLLYRYLSENGFVVVEAADAAQATEMLDIFAVDVLVVDVMMPGQSGTEFTQNLRKNSQIPVLLLTAMGEGEDRIKGLESGADDYLVKPFEPKELLLRLHAILRRSAKPLDTPLKPFRMGAFMYDPSESHLTGQNGSSIMLTEAEVTLIEALASKRGAPMTRDELALACKIEPDSRTIDVQVTRLRRKIEEDTKNPRYLKTVRGVGYVLRIEPDENV